MDEDTGDKTQWSSLRHTDEFWRSSPTFPPQVASRKSKKEAAINYSRVLERAYVQLSPLWDSTGAGDEYEEPLVETLSMYKSIHTHTTELDY